MCLQLKQTQTNKQTIQLKHSFHTPMLEMLVDLMESDELSGSTRALMMHGNAL